MCKINKAIRVSIILSLLVSINSLAQTDNTEIYTLFTTQQERELINSNRYKTDQAKKTVIETKIETPQQTAEKIEQKEESLAIKLTGFTITQSGQNVAWINTKPQENGSELEDGSKVYISKKVNSQVQIKTPDGHYHTVTTGESVELSYFRSIDG